MNSGYLFVAANTEGKSQNDPQRRSHVMLQHFRAKTSEVAPLPPTASHVPPSPSSGKIRFRLNQKGRLSNRRLHRAKDKRPETSIIGIREDRSAVLPVNHQTGSQADASDTSWAIARALPIYPLVPFGSPRVDPFDTLPVRLDGWDEDVLDRLFHYKRYPWCPMNGENRWCPFALSDALVLHVTIYAWSISHHEDVSDTLASTWLSKNPNIIQHKVATIALIKERIADAKERIKDETIAAITLMTLIEVKYGDRDGAIPHLNGLKMLVKLRGGFDTFVSDVQLLIQRFISWTDLMSSELTSMPPAFPPAQVWQASWKTLDQWKASTPRLRLSLKELNAASVPYHRVVEILHKIHRLCHEEQQRPLRIISEHTRMQRGDMFHKVERDLTDILHASDVNTTGRNFWDAIAWRAVTIVSLMFVHHYLRGEGLLLRQFRPLASQLRQILSHMSDDLHEFAFNRALLYWVLSVGAVISTHTPHHDYFLDRIKIVSAVHYATWPEVRALLVGFLWIGQTDEKEYSKVW